MGRGRVNVYVMTFGNGKQYVGITCDLGRRLREHINRPGLLRSAYLKHGFECEIVFSGTRDLCCKREVEIIDELGTLYPFGYNRSTGGDGNDGTPEMRAAIRRGIAASSFDRSKKARQMWSDPKMAEKLKRSNKVRWKNPESRAENAEATRQRWLDPEYRERVSKRIREALKAKKT